MDKAQDTTYCTSRQRKSPLKKGNPVYSTHTHTSWRLRVFILRKELALCTTGGILQTSTEAETGWALPEEESKGEEQHRRKMAAFHQPEWKETREHLNFSQQRRLLLLRDLPGALSGWLLFWHEALEQVRKTGKGSWKKPHKWCCNRNAWGKAGLAHFRHSLRVLKKTLVFHSSNKFEKIWEVMWAENWCASSSHCFSVSCVRSP